MCAERGHDVVAARGDAVGRWSDPSRGAQPAPAGPAWASSTGAVSELRPARCRRPLRHLRRREHRGRDLRARRRHHRNRWPAAATRCSRPATTSSCRRGTWSAATSRPSGDVLLYDDNGTHSAMTTAEMHRALGGTAGDRHAGTDRWRRCRRAQHGAVRAGVQRDRHPDHPQPACAIGAPRRRPAGRRSRQRPLAAYRTTRTVDAVVVDHGVLANDELYFRAEGLSPTAAKSTTGP